MQSLTVGDLVDIEGDHLYRVTAIRVVNEELWVKWRRVHRQTLEPSRMEGREHIVSPRELALYHCRQLVLHRDGSKIYQVRLSYPDIIPDML